MKRLGIDAETLMLVEVTPEGAIVLRQAGVYPLEIYSEQRIEEFDEADRITLEEETALKARSG